MMDNKFRTRPRFLLLNLTVLLAISSAVFLLSTTPFRAVKAQNADSLLGIWRAKRYFGPVARGRLEVVRENGQWTAQIAQFQVPCVLKDGRISFVLPGGEGSFEGRLDKDGNLLRGHWIQPPTVNSGGNFNSPVVFHSTGNNRWSGEVVPLDDEWTVYLIVTRRPDGTLGAFLRNPDRNIGIFWNLDRLEADGNRIKLIGKFLNRGEERVFGEGTHYPQDKRISMYFGNRGGTYDFTPLGDEVGPGFYARGTNPPAWEYRPPKAYADGWKVGTLKEVGMVPEPLAELVRTISVLPKSVNDVDVHGFLIARHGKIVAEEYFHGFHNLKPHETRSASKSVAATLVGAVIQKGAKLDTSTRVYDLLYEGKLPQDLDPRKKEMTVEHVLTMSTGYNCDDWTPPRPGNEEVLEEQPERDYYRFTLQLPMEGRPGEFAAYCSINSNLLGAIVRAATKQPVRELFQDLIAEPLQIQRYYLNVQPTGEPYLGGGMYFLPRDFMKFGQLMLDGGVWNGKRILSTQFVQRASSSLVKIRGQKEADNYGYQWWTIDYPYKGKTLRGYWASGNGGQIVMAIPELDMVIACYGGNYADRAGWTIVREGIPKFILAAVKDESR
jgi:CubicO group peptidase (beta-lactamase class C family)